MLTDLVQIRRLGQQKRNENFRFRAYLKNHRHSDRRLRRFGEEIEAQMDCTTCANCCRVSEVGITDRDVDKLAKFIGVTKEEFLRDFTQSDEEGDLILKKTEAGCVFLKDNLCTVYGARSQNCANFPHVVRGTGSIASPMWHVFARAEFYPIVEN